MTVSSDGQIISPGQLPSHYAPNANVRMNSTSGIDNEILIGLGKSTPAADLNLSPSGDLAQAAANFYGMLREADELAAERGSETIAVSPIPDIGLGRAINDRLRRASCRGSS